MRYIKRHIEDAVSRAAENFKALLLTGTRQTGKSTLLKHLFDKRRYVTLDDSFLEEQAKTDGAMFLQLNEPPVTIDEAQRATELFRYIKMACDSSDERGLFFLSGSQQFRLMKSVSESLAGRAAIFELSTLSLREIMTDDFCDVFVPTAEYILKRSKSAAMPNHIWKIIHRGSYPELQNEAVDWADFYGSYVKTYIERDVRELTAVHDLNAFRRFMIAAASRTGEILNYSKLANDVGKDIKTIKNWISVLEATGIIFLLEPFRNSALNRVIKSPKLYFRDCGLVCYLTRWLTPETLAYGSFSGHIFETFAVSEILKSYSNAGLDYRFYVSYFHAADKMRVADGDERLYREGEIDLILEQNGTVYPIEIKQASRGSLSDAAAFRLFAKARGVNIGSGAIVCNCPQPAKLAENLLQIPVWYI